MPLVIFTATPKLPRDLAHLPYVAGYKEEMSADWADRWLRRGVARIVAPVAADPEPDPEPAPDPGPDLATDSAPVLVRATVADIDPDSATETEMRAWLDAKGATPHHRAGEARLREMCMEILTA